MSPRRCKLCPARASTWQNISRSCKEIYVMHVHLWISNDPTPWSRMSHASLHLHYHIYWIDIVLQQDMHMQHVDMASVLIRQSTCRTSCHYHNLLRTPNPILCKCACTTLTLTHTASSKKQRKGQLGCTMRVNKKLRIVLAKICSFQFPPIDFHLHIEEWIYSAYCIFVYRP